MKALENKNIYALNKVIKRELKSLFSKPLFIILMVGVPIFCTIFFTSLMQEGLPQKLPAGAVDMDNSSNSRNLLHTLNAFSLTDIVAHYPTISNATKAMQEGEIYGFYYIPKDFSKDLQSSRIPVLSFYTDNTYLIPGTLLYKNMKTVSELVNAKMLISTLKAKGMSDEQVMGKVAPITLDTHGLGNPWVNYSIYLSNTVVPGIIILLIMVMTVYSISNEIKEQTSLGWLKTANNSIYIALLGKLFPQTIIFAISTFIFDFYVFNILHFPCNNGMMGVLFNSLVMILGAQGCGLMMVSVLPNPRFSLSFASIWGVISISIAGVSFPVDAMDPFLTILSNFFPLRHFFMIYRDQTLNGYEMIYSIYHYLALLGFMLAPLIVIKRLKHALISFKYIP